MSRRMTLRRAKNLVLMLAICDALWIVSGGGVPSYIAGAVLIAIDFFFIPEVRR